MNLRKLIPAVALLAAVAAGVSYASIPSTSGVISACIDQKGTLKVIDAEAGAACSASQKPLSWNLQGPAGAPAAADRQVVKVSSAGALNASLKTAAASCPAGKIAVGGGAIAYQVVNDQDVTAAHGVAIVVSAPTPTGGWQAAARVVNPGLADANWRLYAYAICVLSS